jgi:hypothetical protein
MEELQLLMLQWAKLDKSLKDLNQQSSTLRNKKDEIHTRLRPLIQTNQLQDTVFSIPSLQTNVSFKEHKTYESISYKFLEEGFNEYFDTQEETQTLLQYLKDRRKKDSTFVLKSCHE